MIKRTDELIYNHEQSGISEDRGVLNHITQTKN